MIATQIFRSDQVSLHPGRYTAEDMPDDYTQWCCSKCVPNDYTQWCCSKCAPNDYTQSCCSKCVYVDGAELQLHMFARPCIVGPQSFKLGSIPLAFSVCVCVVTPRCHAKTPKRSKCVYVDGAELQLHMFARPCIVGPQSFKLGSIPLAFSVCVCVVTPRCHAKTPSSP